MKKLLSLALVAVLAANTFAADWDNQLSISGGYFTPVSIVTSVLSSPILQAIGVKDLVSIENPENFGSYTLAYHHQTAKWFQIGFRINYEYSAFKVYGNSTDPTVVAALGSTHTLLGDSKAHTVLAMLSMQFTYLNTRIVKLYSGIDLGAGVAYWTLSDVFKKDLTPYAALNDDVQLIKDLQEKIPDNGSYLKWMPAGNITLFGITVGTRVYGLAELNIGTESLGKLGLGVRF